MRVFISYRRDDSGASAGRLHETLSNAIGAGQLYKDVDNVALGKDFRAEIERAIRGSEVLIPVIGARWGSEEGLARLHDDHDYVRQEIAQAMDYGLVIMPVLVDGASMPASELLPDDIAPVVYRNAASLSHDTWHRDAEDLITTLRDVLSLDPDVSSQARVDQTVRLHPAPSTSADPLPLQHTPKPFGRRRFLILVFSVVALVVAMLAANLVARSFNTEEPADDVAVGSVAGPSTDVDSIAPPTTTIPESENQPTGTPATSVSSINDSTTALPTASQATTTSQATTSRPTTKPPTTVCDVTIPDLEGDTVGGAVERLKAAGLAPTTGSVADTNLVTGSEPSVGTKVCNGAKVRLDSCAGALVPSLLGRHVDGYADELARQGLVAGGLSSEFSDQMGKDFVVRTVPSAGEQVCVGAAIDVVLSAGPPPCFVVPDVRGMERDEAVALLEAADARFDVATDYGAVREGEQEIGTVMFQPYIGNVFDCQRTDYLRITITIVGSFIPE